MSVLGGLQKKIKIIEVVKNIVDIEYATDFELINLYNNKTYSDEFIKISNYLKTKSFLNVSMDETTTILLRYLLYAKSIIPIIVKKGECSKLCSYTKTPIVKDIYNSNFEKTTIPDDEPVYIIGLVSDIKKLEHTDDFKKVGNLLVYYFDDGYEKIIVKVFDQLKYVYNKISYPFYSEVVVPTIKYDRKVIQLKSWYNDREISAIKFILKSNRDWVYNLDPLLILDNNINLFLEVMSKSFEAPDVVNYFNKLEDDKIKLREFNSMNTNSLKITNMAKKFMAIIENKFGSNVSQKIHRPHAITGSTP